MPGLRCQSINTNLPYAYFLASYFSTDQQFTPITVTVYVFFNFTVLSTNNMLELCKMWKNYTSLKTSEEKRID